MPLEDPASKRGNGGDVASLKATLAKLEVALGATRDAIAWTDEHGRIEWCNAPFDRFAGKRHMAVIGSPIFEALPLDRWTLAPGRHPAKEVLSRRSFVNETIKIARDGKTAYLDFFGSWAQGGGIGPIAVFVVRDVTPRVRREDQLRRATAILEAQQEATLDGILIVDEHGRILKHNERFARMWGIPEEVLATGSDDKALAAVTGQLKDPEAFLDRVRDLYGDREATAHEEVLLKNGKVFDRYSAPIIGPDSAYYGRAWYFRDITTRVQREEALKRATASLEAQQEASLDGIMIVDESGKVISFNRRFAEIWNVSKISSVELALDWRQRVETLSGRMKNPESFLARTRDIYQSRDVVAHDEIEFTDGKVFERYSSPIRGKEGTFYGRAWYFRDVTSRRRAERELEEKGRELARSNAELQQFASAASHDLMEPLRKIAAFGDLLRRHAQGGLDDKGRELLDRIQSAAVRMGALIQDLLQYSRVYGDTRPYEVVDLEETARGVLADLERAIREAGAVVEVGPLPEVYAHPFQMRQLLQNLLANAVKFRRPGEHPRISIRSRPAAEGFVCFEVTDNGIGFEEKFSEKIFEPFLRLNTRSEYEGTGLGLAICRRIASRHGGSISARPSPGGGAVFAVTLPGGHP